MSVDRKSDPLPPLFGGILIGGGSRRMGAAKALLEWEGETFVERIARAVSAVVPELFLFGAGLKMPAALAQHAVVPDSGGASGPLAGLLAAFETRRDAAWLMVSCDQPLLSTLALEWLIAERRSDRIAVLPRLTPARIEPFPGIYEPRCHREIAQLAAPGSGNSLQPIGDHPAVRIVDVPPRFAGEFLGANTPGELALLQSRAGRTGKDRHRERKRPG